MVFYGILDLLAKPVFALVHLFSLRKCDLSLLRLQSGKFSGQEGEMEKLNGNSNTSDDTHTHASGGTEVHTDNHAAPTMVQTAPNV